MTKFYLNKSFLNKNIISGAQLLCWLVGSGNSHLWDAGRISSFLCWKSPRHLWENSCRLIKNFQFSSLYPHCRKNWLAQECRECGQGFDQKIACDRQNQENWKPEEWSWWHQESQVVQRSGLVGCVQQEAEATFCSYYFIRWWHFQLPRLLWWGHSYKLLKCIFNLIIQELEIEQVTEREAKVFEEFWSSCKSTIVYDAVVWTLNNESCIFLPHLYLDSGE